jgi:alkylated DNA repair dioxygenase AlkB
VRAKTLLTDELPEGFQYRDEFISHAEHEDLLKRLASLDFRVFNFQGYLAKRRIVEYGFEYDYSSRKAAAAQPIPEFLEPLKQRAAEWAGIESHEIVEAVITEYPPGAPIGWHRDVPQFGTIIGISLGSNCRMRLKPYKREGRIVAKILEPRSVYLIRGVARWNYQHSIPAVKDLRYSITFRTLRKKTTAEEAA